MFHFFSRLFFLIRDKRIFSYLFLFRWGGGDEGVAVEVIWEDFISEIV